MIKINRALIKLSGEALAGKQSFGVEETVIEEVANQINNIVDKGIQLAVVIGGGNFWRGRSSNKIDRSKADQIGMMATIMNAIYVSEIFKSQGLPVEVFTPFIVGEFTQVYSKEKAIKALENNKVVFFAGGTGHPYFSTDTAAALRAIEIEADVILLAKNIDGVYNCDPKTNTNAKKFDTITLKEIINKQLGVIDLTAAIMCLENKMPMMAFALNEKKSIINTIDGKLNGTYITV